MDATYRSEFRELFEVHFARFDAKLDQRAAELRAEFRQGLAEVRSELIKWMFVFWAGAMLTVVGLLTF